MEVKFLKQFAVFGQGQRTSLARNGHQRGFHHVRAERASFQHRGGGDEIPDAHLTEQIDILWRGSVGDKLISNSEMEKRIKQHALDSAYTEVIWEESNYDSAKLFVDVTIPRLQKLGSPEDVRIIFCFDN